MSLAPLVPTEFGTDGERAHEHRRLIADGVNQALLLASTHRTYYDTLASDTTVSTTTPSTLTTRTLSAPAPSLLTVQTVICVQARAIAAGLVIELLVGGVVKAKAEHEPATTGRLVLPIQHMEEIEPFTSVAVLVRAAVASGTVSNYLLLGTTGGVHRTTTVARVEPRRRDQ